MTDATIELTKAPFDATTALSNGVSKAVSEFTEPTQELTSSTTPGTMSAADQRARRKLEVFTDSSVENLRTDLSRGEGEYLVSLATLAGVPFYAQAAFGREMRDHFTGYYDESLAPHESVARIIEAAWSAGRGNSLPPKNAP
jgi:hypothetical protein